MKGLLTTNKPRATGPKEAKCLPGLQRVYDAKLKATLSCLKFLHEDQTVYAIKVWMQVAKNDVNTARALAIDIQKKLMEEKKQAKHLVEGYNRVSHLIHSKPHLTATYLNPALQHFLKLLDSENFYMAYYFLSEITNLDFLLLIMNRLRQPDVQKFNLFIYYILRLLVDNFLPEIHLEDKRKFENKLLIFAIKKIDFSADFLEWTEEWKFTKRNKKILEIFLELYEKKQPLQPLQINKYSGAHATCLDYLFKQQSAEMKIDNKVVIASKIKNLMSLPPTSHAIQRELNWLLHENNNSFMSQFFMWSFPTAIRKSNDPGNSAFFHWLNRSQNASLIPNGVINDEIKNLAGINEFDTACRGVILYQNLHHQRLSKELATIWINQVIESKEPCKIIRAYKNICINIMEISFIKVMLFNDLYALFFQYESSEKIITAEKDDLSEDCKEGFIGYKDSVIPLNLKKIDNIVSPNKVKLAADFSLFQEVNETFNTCQEYLNNNKVNLVTAVDAFSSNHKSKYKKILNIYRLIEIVDWINFWFSDLSLKDKIKKDYLYLEFYELLYFVHINLTKLPPYQNNWIEFEEADRDCKYDNESEINLFSKATEFFCNLELSRQKEVLKLLFSKNDNLFLASLFLSQITMPNFDTLLKEGCEIFKEFQELFWLLPIEKHNEFIYFHNFLNAPKAYIKQIQKQLVKVISFSKISLKFQQLESKCPWRIADVNKLIDSSKKKKSINDHPAVRPLVSYEVFASQADIAAKILTPAFVYPTKHLYCNSIRVLMLMKWPLAVPLIKGNPSDDLFNRIFLTTQRLSKTNEKLQIHCEVLFFLITAQENEISKDEKEYIYSLLFKYILLKEIDLLTDILISILIKMLDLYDKDSPPQVLKVLYINIVHFFQKIPCGKLENVLKVNKRLQSILKAIDQIFDHKIWHMAEIIYTNIFSTWNLPFSGSYASLLTVRPAWLKDGIAEINENIENEPSSITVRTSSPDDLGGIDSKQNQGKEEKSIISYFLQQKFSYVKMSNSEKNKFFEKQERSEKYKLLYAVLVLGLPEIGGDFLQSVTDIYKKKQIFNKKNIVKNKSLTATLWEIFSYGLNPTWNRKSYLLPLLEIFENDELCQEIKLEQLFTDLFLFFKLTNDLDKYIPIYLFLLKESTRKLKLSFIRYFLNNNDIIQELVSQILPGEEVLRETIQDKTAGYYPYMADFTLYSEPIDFTSLNFCIATENKHAINSLKTAKKIINTISNAFATLQVTEQCEIIENLFPGKITVYKKNEIDFLEFETKQSTQFTNFSEEGKNLTAKKISVDIALQQSEKFKETSKNDRLFSFHISLIFLRVLTIRLNNLYIVAFENPSSEIVDVYNSGLKIIKKFLKTYLFQNIRILKFLDWIDETSGNFFYSYYLRLYFVKYFASYIDLLPTKIVNGILEKGINYFNQIQTLENDFEVELILSELIKVIPESSNGYIDVLNIITTMLKRVFEKWDFEQTVVSTEALKRKKDHINKGDIISDYIDYSIYDPRRLIGKSAYVTINFKF